MNDDIYKNSTLVTKFKNEKWKKNRVLFTDIDDTYIYCSKNNEEQLRVQQASKELSSFLETNSIPLIAVTARDINQVMAGQKSATENLPAFDVIAADMGSSIWLRMNDGTYCLDKKYEQRIKKLSGFDRNKIYSLLEEFITKNKLSGSKHAYIQFQPIDFSETFQQRMKNAQLRPYKISLHITTENEILGKVKTQLKTMLKMNGFDQVKLVFSFSEKIVDNLPVYNCDIIAATKDMAVQYIQHSFHCKGIVAGDSANDRHMIFNSADVAIIVGSCKKELMEEVKKITIPRHKYLASLKTADDEKIFYIEPSNSTRIGPESILRALKLFKEFNILQHASSGLNWKLLS